ncbi:head completion/stabilization protein [Robbsia andropogonis]|uniref:head completion/stabilization protein n=1 Tax=Robbsia andropogonis TaxID=28092 RepID=UPI0020A0F9DC|nr:head completion/stabilization protein [Robbsia andropogonis]MCP1116956.1 head completion/stabilization protein [Robbsia andropogonis]MCP1126365.1 head completion/stabilization protein [Robbsia andropogonis]
MSAFIARPTVSADAAQLIRNDGWFPDIDLTAMRTAMRLDGTVTPERLREAVVDAIGTVNDELRIWQARHRVAGIEKLDSVPASSVDGTSVLVARYRRAVYHFAKADLTERYRDIDTTRAGAHHADELATTIEDTRRNARWAISDIRGDARTTVELI